MCSISSRSTLIPLIFTCRSSRPSNSTLPDPVNLALSPVLKAGTSLAVPLNRVINFSLFRASLFKYPLDIKAEAIYKSPTTYLEQGTPFSSRINNCVSAIGFPMDILDFEESSGWIL
ncbi:hypothetical protein D3C86_1764270 [compost metagenome]